MSDVAKKLIGGLREFADCEHKSLRCESCGARSNIFGWQMMTDYDKIRAELEIVKRGIDSLSQAIREGEKLTRQDGEWIVFVNGECNDDRHAKTLLELVEIMGKEEQ